MSDLIERQAVLNLITENWYASNQFYLKHIKELPAVEPERKTEEKDDKTD